MKRCAVHKAGVRHRAFCRYCGALIPPTRTVCNAHRDLKALDPHTAPEVRLRTDGTEPR